MRERSCDPRAAAVTELLSQIHPFGASVSFYDDCVGCVGTMDALGSAWFYEKRKLSLLNPKAQSTVYSSTRCTSVVSECRVCQFTSTSGKLGNIKMRKTNANSCQENACVLPGPNAVDWSFLSRQFEPAGKFGSTCRLTTFPIGRDKFCGVFQTAKLVIK